MNIRKKVLIFVSSVLAAVSLCSAESSSVLTCISRLLSNGSVLFQLSQGPSSSSCTTYWEDHNKTVLARDKDFVRELVQSLRNDSITLADCRHLLYNLECSGVLQEIDCPVNCSHHVDPDPSSNHLNSTGPDKFAVIIAVAAAAVILVIVPIVAVLWCRHKKKCSSYTHTPQTA